MEIKNKSIIDKDTALDIIKNGLIFITCVNTPFVKEKLEGKIIAESIINPENSKMLYGENTELTISDIEELINNKIEIVKLWIDTKELSVKDGIAKLIKNEIIGQPIGEDMSDPESGEILAKKGQVISKNLVKKILSSKVSDIPLEDGRYFSLEGRLLEYLYKNVVGKISAIEIKNPETGETLINAGKKITRDDAAEISNHRLDIIKIRESDNTIEFDRTYWHYKEKEIPCNWNANYSGHHTSFSIYRKLSFGSIFPKDYPRVNQCSYQRKRR